MIIKILNIKKKKINLKMIKTMKIKVIIKNLKRKIISLNGLNIKLIFIAMIHF